MCSPLPAQWGPPRPFPASTRRRRDPLSPRPPSCCSPAPMGGGGLQFGVCPGLQYTFICCYHSELMWTLSICALFFVVTDTLWFGSRFLSFNPEKARVRLSVFSTELAMPSRKILISWLRAGGTLLKDLIDGQWDADAYGPYLCRSSFSAWISGFTAHGKPEILELVLPQILAW